jgi:putative SOS response-associated peptidase YedK
MCGRYVRRSDKQRIAEAFETGEADDFAFQLAPSYNVAPQSTQPVVRLNWKTGKRELALMRWGLIPYWAKDAKIGLSTINARAETIATNPAFREAVKRRRCLVPADAFYEWQETGTKSKQPYAIGLKDGALFAFAGLWERWRDTATGKPLETYTIITTEPNELLAPLHNRMPVILPPKDYQRWLTPGNPAQLPMDLLRPFSSDAMTAWKVDGRVGNAKNDDAQLIAPED